MKYAYDLPDLEREFANAADFEALEAALRKLTDLCRGFRAPDIYGRKLFFRGVDASCRGSPPR